MNGALAPNDSAAATLATSTPTSTATPVGTQGCTPGFWGNLGGGGGVGFWDGLPADIRTALMLYRAACGVQLGLLAILFFLTWP